MKKTLFKALLPTMSMILVAVMALTGTTYAWFTNSYEANVDNIDIKVTAAAALKVCVYTASGATGWSNTITYSNITNSKDNVVPTQTTNLNPVSTNCVVSNGLLDFYTATVDSETNGNIKDITKTTDNYYKFDIYVWNDSDSAKNITLSGSVLSTFGDSVISGAVANDALDAMRVAMYKQGETLYTQGATVGEITTTASNGALTEGVWEVSSHHVVTGATGTTKGLNKEYAASIGQNDSAISDTVNNMKSNANEVKVNISANSVAKITVYIWLEGQDEDCVNSITKGGVRTALQLSAN